ncbi:MAG: SulP family inorganic anion transporter [Gemmataceae bacterium]
MTNRLGESAVRDSMFRDVRADFFASVVVFLVALPLCMGIALASGAPLAAGIITGIIGGLVVGFLAGSPLQVSGPAAGLSVIYYQLVQQYGFERVGIIVLIAGAIQLFAGLLRLGQWFRAVSPAVIQGMLAGIGVLIFASQFHVMVDDKPKESGIENLVTIPEAVWKGVYNSDDSTHYLAARIGVLTIMAMLLWKLLIPKRFQVIPAPLVGVMVAALEASVMQMPIRYVEMPGNLWSGISFLPALDTIPLTLVGSLVLAGVSMAFIASAETLLCATAVDQMHRGPRTRYDRELSAQGIGNMLCGFLGALPMTGVIVRSATNVEAGARTRLSAILHGAWLLVFVCLVPFVLEWIPTASLAAILVYTGYKLMDVKAIRRLWSYGRSEVLIYAATVITIVMTDLLIGVVVGITLSALKLLYAFSHLHTQLDMDPANRRATLRLEGAATFIRLPKLAAILDTVPPDSELHVKFENLSYIDHACLDLLMNWEQQHTSKGGSLVIDWEELAARFRNQGAMPAPSNGADNRLVRQDGHHETIRTPDEKDAISAERSGKA